MRNRLGSITLSLIIAVVLAGIVVGNYYTSTSSANKHSDLKQCRDEKYLFGLVDNLTTAATALVSSDINLTSVQKTHFIITFEKAHSDLKARTSTLKC